MTGDTSESRPGEMSLSWHRAVAVASGVLSMAALLPFTARPIQWDEFVYMDLAFRPAPSAWLLNRYAHIYAMVPFMKLAGDPYVGARLYWCFLVGLCVGAVVRAALSEPGRRRTWTVALALLLLAGQEALFAYPGIVFADYGLMAVATVAFCFVWARLARGDDLGGREAAIVGLLFLLAAKTKESALPLLIISLVLVIAPSGRVRLDRAAMRLAGWWLVGIALGIAVIAVLDAAIVGDPWFSLRPSSWREALAFYFPDVIDIPKIYVRLFWLREPYFYTMFAPYLFGGLIWIVRERDARRLVLYALPAAFVGQLALLDAIGRLDFVSRYLVPVLPIQSLLTATAFARLRQERSRGFARLAADALILGLVLVGLPPAWHVAKSLAQRTVQHTGEARWAGFYEVARAVAPAPAATFFVSTNLYGGEIRINTLGPLARMNFNLPLAPQQIVVGPEPVANADYAAVTVDEYRRWFAPRGLLPEQVVFSHDGAVALVCTRSACARR